MDAPAQQPQLRGKGLSAMPSISETSSVDDVQAVEYLATQLAWEGHGERFRALHPQRQTEYREIVALAIRLTDPLIEWDAACEQLAVEATSRSSPCGKLTHTELRLVCLTAIHAYTARLMGFVPVTRELAAEASTLPYVLEWLREGRHEGEQP